MQVTGATVQVQKKPSRAFSALLGAAVPKRKFDADVKVSSDCILLILPVMAVTIFMDFKKKFIYY